MNKLFLFTQLSIFSPYALAIDNSGHAFANILIFLAIAILGYIIFGIKKLSEFVRKKKSLLKKAKGSNLEGKIPEIKFTSIQNYKYRFVDLIFSKKILYGVLIFYLIFIFALSNNGKNFWREVQFFILNFRTLLLMLFTYFYVLSQAYLINSSFAVSKKYGRFQLLFPFFLLLLILFLSLIDHKTFSESFLIAIFLMPAIVMSINLIQSSLIFIFKSD